MFLCFEQITITMFLLQEPKFNRAFVYLLSFLPLFIFQSFFPFPPFIRVLCPIFAFGRCPAATL